jgi:hypothetical protein
LPSFAVLTFSAVEQTRYDDAVAFFEPGYACPNGFYDAASLVSDNQWWFALFEPTIIDLQVGTTYSHSSGLYQNLAFRRVWLWHILD